MRRTKFIRISAAEKPICKPKLEFVDFFIFFVDFFIFFGNFVDFFIFFWDFFIFFVDFFLGNFMDFFIFLRFFYFFGSSWIFLFFLVTSVVLFNIGPVTPNRINGLFDSVTKPSQIPRN